MRRASLVVAVLLLAACASSSTVSTVETSAPTPSSTVAIVGSTTAVPVSTNRAQRMLPGKVSFDAVVAIAQACGAPDPACVASEVRTRGLPDAVADNFADLGGQFLVSLVLDEPSFALVIVADPWKANSNETYALVGGVPTVQLVNDRLSDLTMTLPDSFAALRARFPNLGSDPYRAFLVSSTRGADRTGLTFVVPLIDGCRACGIGVGASVTLAYDRSGREISSSVDGACAIEPTEPSDLAACPPVVAGAA